MKAKLSTLYIPILLCLTLGLAPFTPEPHLFGKVRWLLGGANGMQLMDYFDLAFHGFPWVYLIVRVFGLRRRAG
ncbi:hypothetical protein [Fulvivirga sp.]|jgi:hypothetical protein|uniref:hypothetical protein n=1 Tax=Fulvivirga sp. TaxID=1931237 RepID=UPI0032ED5E94